MSRGGAWVVVFTFFLAPGCADRAPQTAEEVYRAFYKAAAEADWDSAVSMLDSRVVDVFREVGTRLATMVKFRGAPLDFDSAEERKKER